MNDTEKAEAFKKAIDSIVDKVWDTIEPDLKKAMEDEVSPEDEEKEEEKKEEKKEDAEKAEGDEEKKDEEKKEEEKEEEKKPEGDDEKLEKLASAFGDDKDEEDKDEEKEADERADDKSEDVAEKADGEEKKDEEKKDEEKKDEEKEDDVPPWAEKALKDQKDQIDALTKSVSALTDRLEKVAHSPSSVRKSVDGRTVAKSGDKDAAKDVTSLKKAAVKDAMVALMQKGEIRGEDVTRYELTGRIADKAVRDKVLASLTK